MQDLEKLAELVRQHREALLTRWREQVRQIPSAAVLDTPTLNDHIPSLLDELAVALATQTEETIPEALREGSPPEHGVQRVKDGFDIEEVVAEYNIMRGCIHDLGDSHGLRLQGKPFHIINKIFDGAIGLAVQTYADQQASDIKRRREEYLAFVAHDLRTPLSAISLSAEFLEMNAERFGGAANATRMIRTLRRNVQRLEELISKVLEENTNLEAESGIVLQRRAFDLWPLVESLVQDLQPLAAAASARLINDVSDEIVVYADAGHLRRIMENMITNAIRYAPRGEVVVGALETETDDGVECWVRDNGAGIPAEILRVVFEKGMTDPQNEEGAGLGLGLAIVKMFAEAHGGKVAVESTEGSGSTFRVWLPGPTALTN